MNEQSVYNIILMASALFGLAAFIALFFITAPYGRHIKKGWGPLIKNTPAWVIMEAPACLFFIGYFIYADRVITPVLVIFLIVWQTHYFHRTFIFPFQFRDNEVVPVSIILFGFLFNVVNTYIQGQWLFTFSPETAYTIEWLTDPRFIIGIMIFYTGFVVNKYADSVLRNLWDPNDPGYKIPHGGLYKYISCPNYLGEMLTWIGWAVATWSIAGLFFALWTIANLGPRAMSNHKWYKENFEDYPKERKALVPFVL